MKNLTLLLLSIFTTISFAHAAKPVTQKYCDNTVAEVVEELRPQVQSEQIELSKANFFISIVRQSCEASIKDGLSIDQYESLFDTVKTDDCKGITNDIYEAMPNYTEKDQVFVSNKINSMCSEAVLDQKMLLILMYEVDQKLKEYGVR